MVFVASDEALTSGCDVPFIVVEYILIFESVGPAASVHPRLWYPIYLSSPVGAVDIVPVVRYDLPPSYKVIVSAPLRMVVQYVPLIVTAASQGTIMHRVRYSSVLRVVFF